MIFNQDELIFLWLLINYILKLCSLFKYWRIQDITIFNLLLTSYLLSIEYDSDVLRNLRPEYQIIFNFCGVIGFFLNSFAKSLAPTSGECHYHHHVLYQNSHKFKIWMSLLEKAVHRFLPIFGHVPNSALKKQYRLNSQSFSKN